MAAFPSPSRGAKVTEGPEHPRSPSPAQPRLLFSCQNPRIPIIQIPPGISSCGKQPRSSGATRGYLGRGKTLLGLHGWGGGMWRDHGLGDASANEGSEKRSKAAV